MGHPLPTRTREVVLELDDCRYIAEYTKTPYRRGWLEPDEGGLEFEAVYVELPALCDDWERIHIPDYERLQVMDQLRERAEIESAAEDEE